MSKDESTSMNKTFLVEKRGGKRTWAVVRQAPHDPQYKLGSKIPGLGEVVGVQNECGQ